jgi:hypothetical protein
MIDAKSIIWRYMGAGGLIQNGVFVILDGLHDTSKKATPTHISKSTFMIKRWSSQPTLAKNTWL